MAAKNAALFRFLVAANRLRVTIWGRITNRWTRAESGELLIDNLSVVQSSAAASTQPYPASLFENQNNQRETCRSRTARGSLLVA